MFISGFVLHPIDRFAVARTARGKIVSTLAACCVCAAVSNGSAAANGFTEFEMTPYISPALSASINVSLPSSFDDRFDGMDIALITDIFKVPLDFNTPLDPEPPTGSVPRRDEIESQPPRQKIIAAAEPIVGIASMYNPTDPTDLDAGNEELASGERYDLDGWSAAIRTDLRKKFGGVRYGRNYQPAYALVESGEKKLIVKINDVGPLRPGRIIDFNVRAMRYFDPTLQLGLIQDVKVTYLAGEEWALGPIIDEKPINVASAPVE